jgi:O-antigen ligase
MKAVGGSRLWAGLTVAWLIACLLLGGASAAGALANAMLQAGAVAIILLLLWRRRFFMPHEARPLAWIIALFLLWVLASLIPLPLSFWRTLPYRAEFAEGLRLLGVESGSLAASLAPDATITSLLALLPPLATFLLVVSLPAERRGVLLGTVVALAIDSIALGVFQLLGGPSSPLRFYAITNDMSAVGLFANVNHNATLALCALPCVAAMTARFAGRRDRSRRSGGLLIAIASGAFLILGIGLMGSGAGYGLALPALVASFFIYRRAIVARIGIIWRIALAAIAIVFVAVAITGPLSQETLSAKFNENPTSRRVIAETTIVAATPSFPLGTGLGTYSDVYRRFQDPAAASQEYVNHAHDDYLEVAIELGAPGLLFVLLFALWWLRRSVAVWREDSPYVASARAGSVIVALVLLHSLVDYPIRTAAIAAIFAMGCALIVPARPSRRDSEARGGHERARHIKVTGAEE